MKKTISGTVIAIAMICLFSISNTKEAKAEECWEIDTFLTSCGTSHSFFLPCGTLTDAKRIEMMDRLDDRDCF